MLIGKRQLIAALLFMVSVGTAAAQGLLGGSVTGNVQMDCQMSRADSTIGARDVDERFLMNARADILYRNGGFSAGLRFEMYQNPLLGFDPRYKGQGLANYFMAWDGERLSVTAGHFYEQFGGGLILRTYEDRYLGLDNALLGMRVVARPWDGVTLKAVVGRQRFFWDYGEGLVRGVDAEVDVPRVVESLKGGWPQGLRLTVGGGFVSRYQPTEQVAAAVPGYTLNLPLNVGAGALRAEVGYKGWSLQGEYARKGHDPNLVNGYIYRIGEALTLTAGYSQRGFSAQLQAKRVDDMGFKSVRSQSGEMLYINYLPAITKNHTYAFLSMYPYATQVNGEEGLQGDVMFKLKKGTALGGKYGTDVHIEASVATLLDTAVTGGAGTGGYTVNNGGLGDLLYGEATVEVQRKLSKNVKLAATYGYQVFNPLVENEHGELHHNNVVVADLSWKVNKRHALRFEGEWLGSDSRYDASDPEHADRRAGDWLMGLVEWTVGSHWFLSLSEQVPYRDGVGNYFSVAVGYTGGATRVQLGYGKQREGMLCVGGVCRPVPASNGLTLSLTTSF